MIYTEEQAKEVFEEYFNKDSDCSKIINVEGVDKLVHGWTVIDEITTKESGQVVYVDTLNKEEMDGFFEAWLKGYEI